MAAAFTSPTDMKNTHYPIVAISGKTRKELSKLQKQFNTYSKKIDKLKQEVVQTQEVLEKAQQKVNEVIIPLEKQKTELKIKLLWQLDKQYDSGAFKKRERDALSDFIVTQVFPLISQHGYDELKPLFEKHEGKSLEEVDQQTNAQTGELMKEMFARMGIDFDDDADLSDVNTFKEAYERKVNEAQNQHQEQQANRKKTEKQLEREEKMRQEASNITKTVRAVYMQLVKAFHPDREPDTAEKERKTFIMQRITQAYETNDLFELLRLQLEYNQKDSGDFALLPDEQLKYYNKLLKEQATELQDELYAMRYGDNPLAPSLYTTLCTPPERLDANVKREVTALKKNLKQLKEELDWLQEPDYVRELLKQHKQMQKQMARNPFGYGLPFKF